DLQADFRIWGKNIHDDVKTLTRSASPKTCVLATGDPMHYGIGATIAKYVTPDAMRVYPAPSAFSLAASHLCWALQDTQMISLHGRDFGDLIAKLGTQNLILTSNGEAPSKITDYLRSHNIANGEMWVLENINAENMAIHDGEISEFSGRVFSDFHVVGLRLDPQVLGYYKAFVRADASYQHDGKITKRAMRTITMLHLVPTPGKYLWDVGAGAGSIAIEWCLSGGVATAIENNPKRLKNLYDNGHDIPRLTVLDARAPDCFAQLSKPDAIFIGGGLSATGMVEKTWQHLKDGGRMVANAVTLEGEAQTMPCQS
ncbi:MAG: precorrin-6y C5,15-methyltransferase (decarboxylating) subunit CbiE, partial [Pseudomonadota bacterium]